MSEDQDEDEILEMAEQFAMDAKFRFAGLSDPEVNALRMLESMERLGKLVRMAAPAEIVAKEIGFLAKIWGEVSPHWPGNLPGALKRHTT